MRKNPQKFWKFFDKFRSGCSSIWLLETDGQPTSACLKQIFFWKKTIKVSGQSPEQISANPRLRNEKIVRSKQVAFFFKAPGYQKGQYFGAFWGAQNCKKDVKSCYTMSKSQLVKSVVSFAEYFMQSKTKRSPVSRSLLVKERLVLYESSSFTVQLPWNNFGGAIKAKGPNELKNLKPFSLKLAFTSPNKKPSK